MARYRIVDEQVRVSYIEDQRIFLMLKLLALRGQGRYSGKNSVSEVIRDATQRLMQEIDADGSLGRQADEIISQQHHPGQGGGSATA